MCGFLSEIQGVWAGSSGGGDRWAAAGKEVGRRHGGDVSQEGRGNEGTCLPKIFKIKACKGKENEI